MSKQKPVDEPRVQMTFYPPFSLKERIDAVVGIKERSSWIIQACIEKLERDERTRRETT